MDDQFQINNLIFKKTKKDNSNEISSELKPYMLTGINDYNNKGIVKPKNLLIPTKIINNQLANDESKKEEKLNINFIRSLIKKPEAIIYDGYICKRKKPTINYLLNKSKSRDNKKILEENSLFKYPYPLLKNISNRKVKNKSRQLITAILGAQFNDLSVEQKKEMLYKPNKSLIKLSKMKYPMIKKMKNISKNITSNNSRDFTKKQHSLSISIISKHKKPSFKNINKHNVKELNLNRFLNYYSLDNKLSDKKRKLLIYDLKKLRLYNNNIKLKEHATMTDNISFLRTTKQKEYENKAMNNILKDISLLKLNKHIMPIDNKSP